MNLKEKIRERETLKQGNLAEKLLRQYKSRIGAQKYTKAMELLKIATKGAKEEIKEREEKGVKDEIKDKEEPNKKDTENNV